jgi:prephenate dehydrogenase
VSHLPHILAFLLMNHVSSNAQYNPDDMLRSNDSLRFAGSGFRDFTRIAGSSPEMWRDICLANREALSGQIDAYQNELTALREMLACDDGEALERVFASAREAQQRWLKNKS